MLWGLSSTTRGRSRRTTSTNEENLETLCRACHAIAHGAAPPIADGLAFDENGNVVEAALMPRPQLDDDEFY